ncbi:MAG: ABC transporter permease [Opitutales bacterium]
MDRRTDSDQTSLHRTLTLPARCWRHRGLLRQFTGRMVAEQYRGSSLGALWMILSPLLMLALYYLVFGVIFGGRFGVLPDESRGDYALGIFFGLTLFQFVGGLLGQAPSLIVARPNFVKKVRVPVELIPLAATLAAALPLLVSLLMVLAGQFLVGRPPGITALVGLPLVLPPLLLLGLGLAWLLSGLGVFFRDLGPFSAFLSQALLYASAVFYRVEQAPVGLRPWLDLNPLVHVVEQGRRMVLWGFPPEPVALVCLWLVSLLVAGVGAWVFLGLQRAFADVL